MYLEGSVAAKTEPITNQQRFIRASFATALLLDEDSIGVDDSFFALGGDSISVMRVLTLCRKENMTITMQEFLSHNTVSSFCTHANMIRGQSPDPAFQKDAKTKYPVQVIDGFLHLEDVTRELELVRSRLTLLKSHTIGDIYSCSDAHNGVLELYTFDQTSTAIFEILPTGSVSPIQVRNAWNQLVHRHAALRTILLDVPSIYPKQLHVVLSQGTAQILVFPPSKNAISDLRKLEPVKSWDSSPLHRLFISQDLSGAVFMRLETGGALIDAFSMSILVKELSLILLGQALPEIIVTYRQYLTHLSLQSPAKTVQYWTQMLHGAYSSNLSRLPRANILSTIPSPPEPRSWSRCLSPAQLDDLNTFWRSNHLTVTNVFQLAWALTLVHYTKSQDVCFGTITSGRDNPQIDVWDLVGSFFNVLPCRFPIDLDCTGYDALYQNQEEIQRRNDHQNCSMPEMVRKSRITSRGNDDQLFNTVLTVQNQVSTQSCGDKDQDKNVEIRLLDLEDSTEYDFCIAVYPSLPQIEVELRYWTSTASEDYASEILNTLLSHLDLIVQNPTKPLSKIISLGLAELT